MPILTFCGVTPSGASARADFAFRKGKKGAFSGAPGRVPKLSTTSSKVIHNSVAVLGRAGNSAPRSRKVTKGLSPRTATAGGPGPAGRRLSLGGFAFRDLAVIEIVGEQPLFVEGLDLSQA